jgi:glycosyltransferase involved in cell wall biosynthesis
MNPAANALATFRVAVCITTMHRPVILETCLAELMACLPPPGDIIVSDDSREPGMIEATMAVVAKFPKVTYVRGPRRGVCANRNRALDQVLARGFDYVTFLDDDTSTPADFFKLAKAFYDGLSPAERMRTIVTGARDDLDSGPVRLNFRSYFEASDTPQSATVASTLFPISMLATERWDENIFFGSEDAELCLRAMARGFRIHYLPSLSTSSLASGDGILLAETSSGMSKYEMYCEAARLYIGIKRYSKITPNPFKLIAFVVIYFAHMTLHLARRGLLSRLVPIVRAANLRTLRGTAPVRNESAPSV